MHQGSVRILFSCTIRRFSSFRTRWVQKSLHESLFRDHAREIFLRPGGAEGFDVSTCPQPDRSFPAYLLGKLSRRYRPITERASWIGWPHLEWRGSGISCDTTGSIFARPSLQALANIRRTGEGGIHDQGSRSSRPLMIWTAVFPGIPSATSILGGGCFVETHVFCGRIGPYFHLMPFLCKSSLE